MGIMFGLGLLFVITGTAMLVFNRQIYGFTGGLDFIENHLRGGTPAFLKLVALILVVVGLLFVTGLGSFITRPIANALNQLFPKNINAP